jgi:hypothetical protein
LNAVPSKTLEWQHVIIAGSGSPIAIGSDRDILSCHTPQTSGDSPSLGLEQEYPYLIFLFFFIMTQI